MAVSLSVDEKGRTICCRNDKWIASHGVRLGYQSTADALFDLIEHPMIRLASLNRAVDKYEAMIGRK